MFSDENLGKAIDAVLELEALVEPGLVADGDVLDVVKESERADQQHEADGEDGDDAANTAWTA